jgi:hypothetical protein
MCRYQMRHWAAIGLPVLMSWLLAAADVAANGPAAFVPGDVIVKFTDASEFGARVTRAMQAAQPPGEAALVAARLSADLGIPLVAAQLTSGRELVLRVERDELVQSLTRRIMNDRAVRGVTRVDDPLTVLPATRIVLTVLLREDSEAAQKVGAAAQRGQRTTPQIAALVARLTAGIRLPPAGHVNERGQLVLVVDVAALTQDLVERLRRRTDVEYAQLSQVVRPFPGSTE